MTPHWAKDQLIQWQNKITYFVTVDHHMVWLTAVFINHGSCKIFFLLIMNKFVLSRILTNLNSYRRGFYFIFLCIAVVRLVTSLHMRCRSFVKTAVILFFGCNIDV